MIIAIRNIQVPKAVKAKAYRIAELSLRGFATISAEASRTSREGGDHAVLVDFADATVSAIGNAEVAIAIHCDAVGIVQLCRCGRPAVAGKATLASARDRL
jgi:hypothetical protein